MLERTKRVPRFRYLAEFVLFHAKGSGSDLNVPAPAGSATLDSQLGINRRSDGSLVAHQTSGAEVPISNPASPTIILGRCRIIMKYCKNLRGRGVDLHLRQKIAIQIVSIGYYVPNRPKFNMAF